MLCPVCEIEMILERVAEEGPVWKCRNPRCKGEGPEKGREEEKEEG